jgi:hypothetical protein
MAAARDRHAARLLVQSESLLIAESAGNEAPPVLRHKGSRRGAARAARAVATSGGTGTFEPSKPRNGRNDPS